MSFLHHHIFAIVNFLIFMVILWAFLKNPLREYLSARREQFRMAAEEADKRRKLADARLKACQRRLENLGNEVSLVLKEMELRGRIERDAIVSAAHAQAGFMQRNSRLRFAYEMHKLHNELYRETVEEMLKRAEQFARERAAGDAGQQLTRRSVAAIMRALKQSAPHEVTA